MNKQTNKISKDEKKPQLAQTSYIQQFKCVWYRNLVG